MLLSYVETGVHVGYVFCLHSIAVATNGAVDA